MAIQLPNETLASIFQNLPPSSLTVVVRASYRFRLVAERILYTSVVIQESLPRETPTPRSTHNCASTLLARPHLAEVVRKFSIRWQTDLGPRDEYLPAVAPALHVLNAALRTLFALEQLDLAMGLAGTSLDAHAVLEGCAFPALRVFALSGVGRGALSPKLYRGPPASASLATFLMHTPSIEALHLLDSYEPLALPPGALPMLQVFRGSAIAAAGVLPARPVRLLGLVGHEFITERDLERIARSCEPIRWLDLSLMSVTPLLLRDISRHLGGAVEVLKVKLALRHTLHFALSGISLLAGLSPVLGAFPALRQLDLSPTSVDGVGRGNALEESALCTTWARACPALRHVVFPSRAEWRRDDFQVGSGRGRGRAGVGAGAGGGVGAGPGGGGAGVWVADPGAGATVWTRH